jgi:hypothetical protein
MDDPDGMSGFEPVDDVENLIDRALRLDAAVRIDLALKRAAGHQLHRHDRVAADLLGAEDEDAVRVIERRGEAPFALEASEGVGRGGAHRGEHLECEPPAGFAVLGFPHCTECAPAELLHQPIRAEQSARSKRIVCKLCRGALAFGPARDGGR